MGKVCDQYCHNCIYYHGWWQVNAHCNYILMMDEVRGCDPGKGCNKKIKGLWGKITSPPPEDMFEGVFEDGQIDEECDVSEEVWDELRKVEGSSAGG